MTLIKMIGYPVGAAVGASMLILFIGMCAFGFHLAEWSEEQGRVVGIVGTIVGIVAAIVGFRTARADRRGRR
jgi:hypothetical protein